MQKGNEKDGKGRSPIKSLAWPLLRKYFNTCVIMLDHVNSEYCLILFMHASTV